MKDAGRFRRKVLGALAVIVGVVSLIRFDWLSSMMFFAMGAYMLTELKHHRLMDIVGVIAAIRLIQLFW